MAAPLHPSPAGFQEVVDLRRLTSRDLAPLLEEETGVWRREMDWDFAKSAELVRRFVDMHALHGSALVEDGEVTGYLYYVLEESKGLIGDLYVREKHRTMERENSLLAAGLGAVMANPAIRRIESQLMMLRTVPDRVTPFNEHLQVYPRNFMRVELKRASLGPGQVRRPMYVERWSDHFQDAAALLIAEAYAGHVDSSINDQYRTPAGARRFLYNIVQYPGCGQFYRPATWVAFEPEGRLRGISLASLVAPDCGHITQICVSPEVKGAGIGHSLLRHSLIALRDVGCRTASLTVTAANEDAVRLYERVGFNTIRRFPAFVWEGF
jgi:ribosomal protein S18 acetylase RimI-like enzyme